MLRRLLPIIVIVTSLSFFYYLKTAGFVEKIKTIENLKSLTFKIDNSKTKEIKKVAPVAPKPLKIIERPKSVKAFYVTGSVAMTKKLISKILDTVPKTEINSLVINVKDESGSYLNQNMANLVRELRERNIYPIARISVFQDNHLTKLRPDLTIKKLDGTPYSKNAHSYFWIDPASTEAWDINAEFALAAIEMGFMEINFDYIRFPDYDHDLLKYPFYDKTELRSSVINRFADFMNKRIKGKYPDTIISADIFAYVLLRNDDQGIGQLFTDLANRFDVIAPMIYPSHYSAGNFNFQNPADHPYEVVYETLTEGKAALNVVGKTAKIRPWIQDFNLGATYDKAKIQAQIKAIKDAGYEDGYMVWNPNNNYDPLKFPKQ